MKLYVVPLVALLSLSTFACSEAERTYDCAKICDAYSDCYDKDLDKVSCVDTCEDKGDADEQFEIQANDCEACIDGASCVDATLECTDECAWVVGASTD